MDSTIWFTFPLNKHPQDFYLTVTNKRSFRASIFLVVSISKKEFKSVLCTVLILQIEQFVSTSQYIAFNSSCMQFSLPDCEFRYHRFYAAKKRVLHSSQYDLKKLVGRTKALPDSTCMTVLIFRVLVDQLTP